MTKYISTLTDNTWLAVIANEVAENNRILRKLINSRGNISEAAEVDDGGSSGIADIQITNVDESISVGTSYANALVIDSRVVKDSAIILFNDDASKTCDYKIFGTTKTGGNAPIDADDSWVNILDKEVDDPSLYDDTTFKTLPAKGVFYESYSNKWTYVRIQMKSSSGTLTAKIWHRGIN